MSAKAKNKLTPQQRKATLNRVLHKIRPYSAFVVCSLLVAAVSVAAQLYIPILCGDAIDKMLGKGNVDLAGVLRIAVSILVVAAVAALAQWLLSVCNNRITFSVSRDLRNEALRKIQTLPLSYLDSHPSGDIVSRMVADVDTFADGLLMGFTQLFSGILTIFGTLLFMLRENVPITLVVVCITPLSLVVAGFLAKRSYGYFQSQSTVRGKQTALVNEMIEGQKVVQAFGHEAESLAAFDEVNGQLQDVSLKAIFFSSLTNPATRFVNNIVYAGVGLVGALAGLHIQREPLDERTVGQVAEGHILQLHMAVRLQRGGVFGFRHLILGVQQFKHPGGAGQCILQLGDHARDLVEGLCILVGVA